MPFKDDNAFYKVTKPHPVKRFTGQYTQGSDYVDRSLGGHANIQRASKDHVVAEKGDEIHDLIGGRFLVKKNGDMHQLDRGIPHEPVLSTHVEPLTAPKKIGDYQSSVRTTQEKSLQTGAKGGSFYITATGRKVYKSK